MTPQESFVTRLRRYRQRNQISLDHLAIATRVKRELLEGLESNDLTGWPQGLYARAWIRSYAAIVGLDPDDTVDDFCRLYQQGDRRAQNTMVGLATIVDSSPEYRDEFPHVDRRRRSTDGADVTLEQMQVTQPAPVGWYVGVVNALRPLWLRVMALAPTHKSVHRGLN
jgi:hypothetical protein